MLDDIVFEDPSLDEAHETDSTDDTTIASRVRRPGKRRLLLGIVATIFVFTVVTASTGHALRGTQVLVDGLVSLPLAGLIVVVAVAVCLLEACGVLTSLLALAVGAVFGAVLGSRWAATCVGSAIGFPAVCLGCVAAYSLGKTYLRDWAMELRARHALFDALDAVLETQGVKVQLLLRMVAPDSLINLGVAASSASFTSFAVGLLGLAPWWILHVFYGAALTSLVHFDEKQDQFVVMVVTVVASTLLAAVLFVRTKVELDRIISELLEEREPGSDAGLDLSPLAHIRQPCPVAIGVVEAAVCGPSGARPRQRAGMEEDLEEEEEEGEDVPPSLLPSAAPAAVVGQPARPATAVVLDARTVLPV